MDIQSPVGLPRFDDEQMLAKKRAYVEKHGYVVSFPRIRDIIHWRIRNEPNQREFEQWRKKDVAALGSKRFNEISQIIGDKRRKYNTILGSPVPTMVKNYVSTLTFLDDINDALGTAGIIMRFLAKFAPRFLARFLLGPAGWLFIAAAIFALIIKLLRGFWLLPHPCVMLKAAFTKYGDMNPFSKKAKAKRARKLKRLWPSWGEMIELLQVTDSMFGIGLCLGPLFGAAFDFVSGTIRSIRGEKVSFVITPPSMYDHEKTASRALRAAPFAAHMNPILDDNELAGMYFALYGSAQVMRSYWELWDPLDNIITLDGLEVEAPRPRHPTTLHVLAEHDWNGRDGIGWPGTDERWSAPQTIAERSLEPSKGKLQAYAERNSANIAASFAVQAAASFFKELLAQISDTNSHEEEWEDHAAGWAKWMEDGCVFQRCHSNFKHGQTRYQI